MNDDPAKQAWQASVEIAGAPPLEEVRKGVNRFYRFISWRNGIEYVACAIGAISFSVYVFTVSHLFQKVGSVMIAGGVPRGVAAPSTGLRARADAAGLMPLLEFARRQLTRQRDALRGLFRWYVLPFLPGLTMIVVGNSSARMVAIGWPEGLFLAGLIVLFGGVFRLNLHFASEVRDHIDEIDALLGEGK
jgi:hypothetical protein